MRILPTTASPRSPKPFSTCPQKLWAGTHRQGSQTPQVLGHVSVWANSSAPTATGYNWHMQNTATMNLRLRGTSPAPHCHILLHTQKIRDRFCHTPGLCRRPSCTQATSGASVLRGIIAHSLPVTVPGPSDLSRSQLIPAPALFTGRRWGVPEAQASSPTSLPTKHCWMATNTVPVRASVSPL